MDRGSRGLLVESSRGAEQDTIDLSDLEPSVIDQATTDPQSIDGTGWGADPFRNGTPSLSYMESDVVTQAVIMDQQRKIKELENDLSCAQAEIRRLRSQAKSNDGVEKHKRKAVEITGEKKSTSRYWTSEEHQKFLEGLEKYGHKDVKAISNYVETRNATQVRTHAQKYYLRLSREGQRMQNQTGSPMSTPSGSHDATHGLVDAGGSDAFGPRKSRSSAAKQVRL